MAFALKSTSAFMATKPSARISRSSSSRVAIIRCNAEQPTESTPASLESSIPEAAEPTPVVATPTPPAPAKAMGFGDIMAFSGPGPELINGRLAMLGMVAALGAEFSSNESIFKQFADAPGPIIATFLVFIVASLIPMFKNVKAEAFGPFTPKAEMANGRSAMLGLASLIVIEAIRHSALF